MNYKDLYETDFEINGDTVFYEDEECTIPFTGHVEEYWNGKLSWECDIVNGLREGIEKTYYDNTGELEIVNEVKNNNGYGLAVEYYKSGRIKSISFLVDTVNADGYIYDETGNILIHEIMNEENSFGIAFCHIKEKLDELRRAYDLEKINEDIQKYGEKIDIVDKYFRMNK